MLLTRRIAVAGALTVASFAGLAGSASAHFGSSNNYDRVIGAGLNSATDIAAFVLDARSGPNGEDPFGVGGFATKGNDPSFNFIYNAGTIQCLRVSGNTATLVYKVKWQKRPADLFRFDATRVYVQDNGYPTKLSKPVDRVRNTLFDSSLNPSLLDCPDPADPATTEFINKANVLTAGDVIVKDAS